MENQRLQALSNYGQFWDGFHVVTDYKEKFPIFQAKISWQNSKRSSDAILSRAKLQESLHNLANLTAKPEKEADWAITGGLAQGIGGLGAGIAAAVQTQANNMEIRQRNAQRASDAQAMHYAADHLPSVFGHIEQSLLLGKDEINRCGFSTATSTEELFSKISFDYSFDKPYAQQFSMTIRKDGTIPDSKLFKLVFSTSHIHRIDGYILIDLMDEKGKIHFEKIVPLPMLGVGAAKETARLGLDLPNGVRSISIKPLVLWEIVRPGDGNVPDAKTLSDLPATHVLNETYRKNYGAHVKFLKRMKNRKTFKRLAVLGILLAIIAAALLIYSNISTRERNEHNFEMGINGIYSKPSWMHKVYLSELPDSYHERIADEYIRCAQIQVFAEYNCDNDLAMEYLEYAALYAQTEAQKQQIRELYIPLYANTEGQAHEYILRLYNEGHLTPDQVIEHARELEEADAQVLVDMFKYEHAGAAALDAELTAYRTTAEYAREQYYASNFSFSLEYFSQHPDELHALSFMGLSQGAVDLFGTWTNGSSTLTIAPIAENPFTAAASSTGVARPVSIDLQIKLDGNDISYSFDKRFPCELTVTTDPATNSATYHITYHTFGDDPGPYQFDLQKNGTLSVTHIEEKRDVYNKVWTRIFTRTD